MATVIIFLIVGVLTIVGILGGEVIGFSNFTAGDAPFKGGFFAILGTFLIAGFLSKVQKWLVLRLVKVPLQKPACQKRLNKCSGG
ncbi:hypothetical protein OK15_00020, partial [Listeria monocytogenes]